jgi:hypothetical protein
MDFRLATLKAVYFYLLHSVSTLYQRRNFPVSQLRVKTLLAKVYPNYRWDLTLILLTSYIIHIYI